jgi:hypothetical protein
VENFGVARGALVSPPEAVYLELAATPAQLPANEDAEAWRAMPPPRFARKRAAPTRRLLLSRVLSPFCCFLAAPERTTGF